MMPCTAMFVQRKRHMTLLTITVIGGKNRVSDSQSPTVSNPCFFPFHLPPTQHQQQVLSPMSAYFDGPPSFFPGQAASAAPLPGLEEAAEHSGPVQRERPVVPQQVTVGGRKVKEVLVGKYFFSSNILGKMEVRVFG